MLATNHLIASQYSPICTKIMRALRNWIRVRETPTERTIAPKYHHRIVTGRPVKARFGRSGTFVRETIHLLYMTMTHGTGMTNKMPMKRTRDRQVNSQTPNSIGSRELVFGRAANFLCHLHKKMPDLHEGKSRRDPALRKILRRRPDHEARCCHYQTIQT